MPVSANQQANAQSVAFAFTNSRVPVQSMTAVNYRDFASIRPKGLRGSMLKLINWPTSWAILYDLSPAQISQDREAEGARSAWNNRAGEDRRLLIWKKLLRAYFVGQPDPMPESEFPRWRTPFWMTDAERLEIDNLIREAYANEGDPSMAEVADGDVSLSEEQTTDAPMSPMPPVEDTPTEEVQQDSPNVRRLNQVEGVYQLYATYFSSVHGVTRDQYLQAVENQNSAVRQSATAILALEKLKFDDTAIRDMLATFANRSLAVSGLRQGNKRGYGAFIVVDLVGIRTTARAYQRSVSRAIMATMGGVSPSRVDRQFRPEGSRPLQTFKFSGMRRRQVVGLQVLSMNDISGTPNEDTLREGNEKMIRAREEARQVFNAQVSAGATDSTTPISSDTGEFNLFAVQSFRPGRTYLEQGVLFTKGKINGQRQSLIFYFVKFNRAGRMVFGRNVFGETKMNVPRFDVSQSMMIEGLKRAWNESGKLDDRNKIKIQNIPGADLPKIAEAYIRVVEGQIGDREFGVTRNSGGASIAFSDIQHLDSMGQEKVKARMETVVEGFEQAVETEADDGAEIRAQVKSKRIDRTFGYEIEGNFLSALNSDPTTNDLNKREARRILTENLTEVLDERGINEMEFRRRFMINPESVPEEYRVMANGFGSIDLMGDISVAGGNAFEVATPVFIPPNDEKSKSSITRRISSAQYEAQQFKKDSDMWKWVSVFSEALLRSQVQIHKSAGLHIHVSIEDYTREDKTRYLENYAGFEPLIDLMMPLNSRVGGRSFNSSIIQRGQIRTGGHAGSDTPVRGPSYWRRGRDTGRDKVRTDTEGKGTIEFRHPMANIENDLIHHMIELAYRLVEVSKSYQFTSFKWSDLSSILPKETATFLYNRIEDMSMPEFESNAEMRKFFNNNEPIRARFGGEKSSGSELKRRGLR